MSESQPKTRIRYAFNVEGGKRPMTPYESLRTDIRGEKSYRGFKETTSYLWLLSAALLIMSGNFVLAIINLGLAGASRKRIIDSTRKLKELEAKAGPMIEERTKLADRIKELAAEMQELNTQRAVI